MKKEKSKTSKSKVVHFDNAQVAEVFAGYSPEIRKKLLFLRQLIFETAKDLPEVGELEETLKWGEPSYLTKAKIGSTVRIHQKKNQDDYAMYFNCQTNLVASFKKKYPKTFKYEGKRAIVFNLEDSISAKELKECITMALTYHLTKPPK